MFILSRVHLIVSYNSYSKLQFCPKFPQLVFLRYKKCNYDFSLRHEMYFVYYLVEFYAARSHTHFMLLWCPAPHTPHYLTSIGLLAPSNGICCFVSPAAGKLLTLIRTYVYILSFLPLLLPRVYPTRHGPNLMTEALVKKPSQISCNCPNSESLFPVGLVEPASSASSIIRLVDSSTLPLFLFSVHLSYKSFQSRSVGKLPFLIWEIPVYIISVATVCPSVLSLFVCKHFKNYSGLF